MIQKLNCETQLTNRSFLLCPGSSAFRQRWRPRRPGSRVSWGYRPCNHDSRVPADNRTIACTLLSYKSSSGRVMWTQINWSAVWEHFWQTVSGMYQLPLAQRCTRLKNVSKFHFNFVKRCVRSHNWNRNWSCPSAEKLVTENFYGDDCVIYIKITIYFRLPGSTDAHSANTMTTTVNPL